VRPWRSIEFRLAAWYSLLLLGGLTSLGAVLWFGINYSMVAAVDDLLAEKAGRLVDFIHAEFKGNHSDLRENADDGEVRGQVERVDPRHEWLQIHGTRIYLTPQTVFAGRTAPFRAADLQQGQYVEVAVERAGTGGEWAATTILLNTTYWDELREDLNEYALAVPEGRLTHIRTATGQILLPVRSQSDAQTTLPWLDSPTEGQRFFTVETAEGSFRVHSTEAVVEGSSCRIQVASSLAALTATKARLLSWILWAGPVGLVLSLCGGYVISRAALRPVENVVGVAGRMDVNRLSERLEVPATGDVVQRLAETFNGMLGRLEASVRRLEEFTADASHELRSPVTVIRTTAELAVRQARTREELRKDMQGIQAEAARLTELIEDLLTLARADSGGYSSPMDDVDLGALVREVTKQYGQTIGQRKLHVEIAEEDAVVTGHAPSLRRLLVILLDNAVQHTPADTSIRVVVRGEREALLLSVADTGEGILPQDLSRVFDRFYRVDSSRNRFKGGFGLGLSIAKWIVESHSGNIAATSQVGKGTTFSAHLPRQGCLSTNL
jgi:two-component system, OmpR family, heavy metal sensor histidine kinase CusS